MERSRRDVLAAGGALGAVGALASAVPAWSWSPLGSVAGAGAGLDPRNVWDAEADPVVAAVVERGQVGEVNKLLRTWRKNGQALPAGLPADLREFMEHARRLPAWTDQEKLRKAVDFNEKRGLYLGVTYGFASGMMSTVIPREARAVYYSKGGADMRDRITKTAKLGYDVGSRNAFAPDGEMIVTCVKTRLAHAGVRHLLPKSIYWRKAADEQIPISQADMMVTWHSLPTTVMQNLTGWKVPIDAAESAAFLHSWQLTAHMLGILDEYIPASWAEADAQAAQVLTPILAPTPEGIKLADTLLGLGSFIDGSVLTKPILSALTRYVLGEEIADWLKIRKTPFWDGVFETAWEPFIAVREGLLKLEKAPGILQQTYWAFDEVLRLGVLLLLSGAKFPISIEIPHTNNPNY
ncbi:oxygenase MpaB family protein [Actinocorallia sp. A-T 12471]|uniref:oxygenase MpaB family protein n=1 Tax=Actinocorallia sp. A-T 12471 TaxID=3089813 RepID=UPI0029D0C9DA|nr:oxygenase MpaB family protein [Actinocorallia sp. A-T 12471]MDX6740222.1 oxygenase MpaB family protein [Actinocorallia sp. A-T 12471]